EFLTGQESVLGNRPFIDYLYQNNASVDGQWNGVWGIFRVYNGRRGLMADLLALPNNLEGAAQLSTNDSSFTVDTAFPNCVTDYKDATDASVTGDTTPTTDTRWMSPDMMADTTATGTQGATLEGGLTLTKTIVTALPTD